MEIFKGNWCLSQGFHCSVVALGHFYTKTRLLCKIIKRLPTYMNKLILHKIPCFGVQRALCYVSTCELELYSFRRYAGESTPIT